MTSDVTAARPQATDAVLLRPEEAADRLAIGRSKLYELMAAGEIESVLIGRSRRVPVAAVEAYVERLRAEQCDHRCDQANGFRRTPPD